ncbi:MAG: ABC transporter ATP-binding protein [Alphaproteobacteria bacterium]|nr:ABC transporter ATP-binding protein [Alphaproteobacteria bacterium]
MTKDTKDTATYRDALAFAWRYWARRPGLIATSLAMMVAATAVDAVWPLFTGGLVDALASGAPGDAQALRAAVGNLAVILGLGVVYHVLHKGSFILFGRYQAKNIALIQRDMLRTVHGFSTQWHADAFAGATVRKITRGAWAFDMLSDNLFLGILPAAVAMVGVSGMLIVLMPPVGVFTAAMCAVYITLNVWITVRITRPLHDASAAGDTRLGARLADVVTGNAIVKAFGTEAREEARYDRLARAWHLRAQKAWNTNDAWQFATAMVRETMIGGMFAITLWLWWRGQATPGDIALVLTAFFMIAARIWHIGQNIADLQKAVSEMADIVAFHRRAELMADAPGAVPFRPGAGEIRLECVRFGYLEGREPLFDGLDLAIRPGEKVALVGRSGSGKTTLIKLIQRLYDVNGGAVRIDSQDVRDVTQASLRAAIALVPQEPALFHRSIAANIAYGRPGASRAQVVEAAKKAHAHAFIERLPQGYATLVGERGVKLSGGERQRVAIARAILADCRILILDEATSSLDSVSEGHIQAALEALMSGRTCITVAHRLSTVRAADRILVMDRGRVVEEGTHVDLLAHTGSAYAALHTAQAFYG